MREVVIVSSVRYGSREIGQRNAARHADRTIWPPWPSRGALDRIPQLDKNEIEDVIIGCATPKPSRA